METVAAVARAAAEVAIDSSGLMILIADSGATKTDWCYGADEPSCRTIRTAGINPFHQSEEEIRAIISTELIPGMSLAPESFSAVFFYGAGCTPEKAKTVSRVLAGMFPHADVSVESDLTGAARALFGHEEGVACILGTGSNSGLYDGDRIIRNTPPLGYILGDEGSGAYLGKRFVGDCLKGVLPTPLKEALLSGLGMDVPELIDRVYRRPQANRFLATVSPIIYRYKEMPEVKAFLLDCFRQFFERNVLPYRKEFDGVTDNRFPRVSFVGSVGWFYQDELRESAQSLGIEIGRVIKEPLPDLKAFHFAAESEN